MPKRRSNDQRKVVKSMVPQRRQLSSPSRESDLTEKLNGDEQQISNIQERENEGNDENKAEGVDNTSK